MGPDGKIASAQEVRRMLDAEHPGATLVLCHGCFDIVHPGHIRHLRFAKSQGDLLAVSVTADRYVGKGPSRPIFGQDLRMENLAALECVDFVCLSEEPWALALLDVLKPDVYVKGKEYEDSTHPGFLAEKNRVEALGGRILFSSGEVVYSSTQLIDGLSHTPAIDRHPLAGFCERNSIRRKSVRARIEAFRDTEVLVLGDAVLDRYRFCRNLGCADEGPFLTVTPLREEAFPGAAGVVACHVAAMGGRAVLASPLGGDEEARFLRERLEHWGVQIPDLGLSERPTVVKERILADGHKVLKIDRLDFVPIAPREERRLVDFARARMRSTRAVVFCDFGYGALTRGLVAEVTHLARANEVPTLVDLSSAVRGSLLDYHGQTVALPTEREARASTGGKEQGLSVLASQIFQRSRFAHLFIKMADKGMVAFANTLSEEREGEVHRLPAEYLPSLAPYVADPMGAGDAMLAAAALTLGSRGTHLEAAYIGSLASALEVAESGNAPIEAGRLLDWLDRQDYLV